MDFKAKVEEIVAKLKGDSSLMSMFNSDPVKTVEKLIGKDLPDEQVKGIVDAVKAKLGSGSSIKNILGGLFGKK